MELKDKIDDAKMFFGQIFLPTMKELFKESSPEKYEKWQGNCCRQTAVIGCHILSNILPEFEWNAWEAEFEDMYEGRSITYVHAWIYAKSPDMKLLVDMARSHKENLFIETLGNRFPKGHPDYKDQKEVRRSRIDWRLLLDGDVEYYTLKKTRDVVAIIFKRILEDEARKRALIAFSALDV